jgi:hypothetical protein
MRAVQPKALHNAQGAMSNLGLLEKSHSLLLAIVTGLLSTSCTISNGIADFGNDVANQSPVTFGPSHRVVAGHFSSPIVDPWDDRGPVIIAFEYVDGNPHLAMRPVDGTQGCDTGIAYSSVVRDKLDNRAQLVAYLGVGEPGHVPLSFVDHNCNEYGQPIIGGGLPEHLYSDPPGYLVKVVLDPNTTPVTQLWDVDPWNGTHRVVADNVTWFSIFSKDEAALGVVDGGHFKVFDSQRNPVSDVGTAVTEILFLSGQSGPFLLVDGGVLRKYQSTADTVPSVIAEDVCQVSQDGSAALYYYSPCSSRQLQRYLWDSGRSTIIDSGIGSLVSSRNKAGTTDVFALYSKSNVQGGQDLWLYSPDAAPALVVSQFNRLYDWAPPPMLEILALVNADAYTGQLIRHDSSGDSVLANSVSVGFSEGMLANFDAGSAVGDLYFPPQLGGMPQLAVRQVPYVKNLSSIVTSKNAATVKYGTAIIANASAGKGDLLLTRYPSPTSPGPELPVTLASNVRVGNVKFFEAMNAVSYIENWDDELVQGHLVVKELTLDASTDISDEVREFQEVKFPSEGIMYVIPEGDRAGIWAAKAK